VQLDLNRWQVADAGCESAVEARHLLDVRDTGRFSDQEFDAVVAFGGPLSYVFEDAQMALAGLLRVGKVVLGSVMSTLGAWRFFLPQVVEQTATIGEEATDLIIESGELRHEGSDEGHTCQMYRYQELVRLVSATGGEILSAVPAIGPLWVIRGPSKQSPVIRRVGAVFSSTRSRHVENRESSPGDPHPVRSQITCLCLGWIAGTIKTSTLAGP
jgi:hypothetical protein